MEILGNDAPRQSRRSLRGSPGAGIPPALQALHLGVIVKVEQGAALVDDIGRQSVQVHSGRQHCRLKRSYGHHGATKSVLEQAHVMRLSLEPGQLEVESRSVPPRRVPGWQHRLGHGMVVQEG